MTQEYNDTTTIQKMIELNKELADKNMKIHRNAVRLTDELYEAEAQRDEFLRLSNERYEKIQQLQQEKLDYQKHMLSELRKSDQRLHRYMQALTTILAKEGISSEIVNIINNAIEGAESNESN